MTATSARPVGKRLRSAVVALVLSIFGMGAGYFYLGRPARALMLIGWSLASLAAAFHGLNGWLASPAGFATYVALTVVIFLVVAVDTIRIARKSQNFVPRWCNRIVFYVTPVLVWAGLSTIHSAPALGLERALQPYAMPSTSMTPAVRIGERVMADAFAYRTGPPRRGDIAVVNHASGNVFVKRVIGLPGDRVSMVDGVVVIDGKPLTRRAVPGPTSSDTSKRFLETLPGGPTIEIQQAEEASPLRTMQETVVPEGHYFLLGDNRDNSVDSRMAPDQGGLGFVRSADFRARVTFIYWSVDTARIGLSLLPR